MLLKYFILITFQMIYWTCLKLNAIYYLLRTQSKGFTIDVTSGKALADSLDQAVVPENPYFNTMLRIMTTRCMMQAVYFSSGMLQPQDYLHYGLATPIYTHFTSPIRRYVKFKFFNKAV